MFKLASPDQVYDCTVQVEFPTPDGATDKADYTARFKLLPDSFILENDDAVILQEAMVGWEGIDDHTGSALRFSKKNLEKLCDLPYWRRATILAYTRFASGLPAKNSAAPSDTGSSTAPDTETT